MLLAFDWLDNIVAFFEAIIDGILGFFELVANLGKFVVDTIASLISAVSYVTQAAAYVTGFSDAVPFAIFSMLVTMLSFCVIYLIIGRVK